MAGNLRSKVNCGPSKYKTEISAELTCYMQQVNLSVQDLSCHQ